MERTLAIIKPEAVAAGLVGKILARLEDEGFRILGLRLVQLTKSQACSFYQVHAGRPFYESLTAYMVSGPVVPVVLEREEAVERLRALMGATNPQEAAAGTLRREFGQNIERNAIHGSDSPSSAATEIPFFFSSTELCTPQ